LILLVLSGVGSLANLTPLADFLMDTVDTLQDSFVARKHTEPLSPDTAESLSGLNPDPAY